MQTIDKAELVPFPSAEPAENFKFDCTAEAGNFTFHFKWLNNRWNLWVTLPTGEVREAGVQPGVTSWSQFSDYGIYFKYDASEIDFNSLFLTELYLITWL